VAGGVSMLHNVVGGAVAHGGGDFGRWKKEEHNPG
jgi:hypothetical protein